MRNKNKEKTKESNKNDENPPKQTLLKEEALYGIYSSVFL